MDIYKTNGQVITPTIADSPTFRICAFNVGNFSGGLSGTPAGTDSLYNLFMETFQQCNANIYMFSEWDKYWVSTTPSSSVWGFLKPYKSTYIKETGWMGQMNYSDYPIESEYYADFPDSSGYYFLDNVVTIAGKEVHLICTHLTWQSNVTKMAEMQNILDYIEENDIEYYIIGGDMNLGSDGQGVATDPVIARTAVTKLESDGAFSVQGSGWGCKDTDGFFNTYGAEGWYVASDMHMADNVAVSPNIRVKNVWVIKTEASDHNALCVDLEIA